MNVFITGGLGFVGRNLSNFLLQQGNRVTAVGLSKNPDLIDHPEFRYISADTTRTGAWQQELGNQQVVVNLAGRSIFKRWTDSYKKQIIDSRILTTRNLVNALPSGSQTIFCSTSVARVVAQWNTASPPGRLMVQK